MLLLTATVVIQFFPREILGKVIRSRIIFFLFVQNILACYILLATSQPRPLIGIRLSKDLPNIIFSNIC